MHKSRVSAKKSSPYLKVKRAALDFKGCRLTAEDCELLYIFDHAFKMVADDQDDEQKERNHEDRKAEHIRQAVDADHPGI